MNNRYKLKGSLPASILLLALLFSGVLLTPHHKVSKEIRQLEAFLVREYRKVPPFRVEKGKELAADQPEMAALQDYFMTLDPASGVVPRERLRQAYRQTQEIESLKSGSAAVSWQGFAADMGGRTRTLMYDPNDVQHKKVWAGGITGGLWYNTNISNAFSSWVPVSDFWPCLAVRCITFDPNNHMIFYVGTGEVETARQTYRESSGVGDGIWKSIDGGQTWNQLASTTGFAYVTDVAVRNENGNSVIYAGVASGLYKESQHQSQPSDGLFRSTDGGTTWQQVLPNISGNIVPYAVSDIAISEDGARIFVGTRPNLDGEGGATILYSNDGTTGSWVTNEDWKLQIESEPLYNIPGRVVLACAPSNPDVVFALLASGYVNPNRYDFEDYYCRHILGSTDKGDTWVRKNTPYNFNPDVDTNFANLAWHALDIAIDPNNINNIYIGGLDVYKTTDGCGTWSHLSDWALMYYGGGSQYIHADQHVILFKPGSSSEVLFGSDGGVFYTANGNASQPDFEEHNHNYNTLQFYSAAIKPTTGANVFLGGLQDNGSLRYTGSPLSLASMVSGGDGAYAFYDKNEPFISISSIYYNYLNIFTYDNQTQWITDWYPSGVFVNPTDYDYRTNTIYANACSFTGTNLDYLLRISNVTNGSYSGTFIPLNTGTQVYFSAVKWSPWSPTGKATLFVATQSGRLFKIQNAESSPTKTEITGSNFPAGNISSIAIGGSEDTLLVTFSNYGVASVFQTHNGGQTWENKEGNLPDMPIRWAIYHPQNSRQVMLATETGAWTTSNLDDSGPLWEPVNEGMANVRIDMLSLRESDRTVLAATHGRGFFTTTWDVVTGMNSSQPSAFSCYPNPSSGQFNLAFHSEGTQILDIKIYNPEGKLVYQEQKSTPSGNYSEQADISNQPSGIYFLKISGNGKILKTEKIIKY